MADSPQAYTVASLSPVLLAMLLLGVAHGQQAQVPPAQLEKAKALVAKLDLDRDGRVSLVEYAAAKLRELNGGNGGNYRLTPKSDAGLKGLDTNKDGAISAEEYTKSYVAEEFRYLDQNRDGFIDPNELAIGLGHIERAQLGEKKSSFIERYDLDKDGKVARAEWPGSDAVFDRLDRNRDGTISAADMP